MSEPFDTDKLVAAYEALQAEREALAAERERLAALEAKVAAEFETVQRDRAAAQSRSFIEQIVQQTLQRKHD